MKYIENVPIYFQIANDIKENLVSGKLSEGEKLSSIREYSLQYEVTNLTIQRAMQQLELEGIIISKKGIGSFIVEGSKEVVRKNMIEMQVKEFVERMSNMGIDKEEIIDIIKKELDANNEE